MYREEMELFIADGDMRSLMNLREVVWEKRFLPTAERNQEGDHSWVHRGAVLRTVGGPYVSCLIRMPEVESLFDRRAEFEHLIDCFAMIAKPDDFAKRFGFWKHPLWQQAVQEKRSSRERMSLVEVLLYSLDVESQYVNLTKARGARQQRQRAKKKKVDDWRASFQAKEYFSPAAVMKAAMADHIQSVLKPGQVYSMPVDAASLPGMQQAMRPQHEQQRVPAGVASGLEADVEDGGAELPADALPGEGDAKPLVFFRVIAPHAGRHKQVPLAAAAARKVGGHDLCVTIHRADLLSGCWRVNIEPERAMSLQSPVHVLATLSADLDALCTSLSSWRPRSTTHMVFDGIDPCTMARLESVTQLLVSSRAFPNAEQKVQVAATDVDAIAALQRLEELKLVTCCAHDAATSAWKLSREGAARLRVAQSLHARQPVFQKLESIDGESLDGATSWQLAFALQSNLWELRQMPSAAKRRTRPLPPIIAGGPRAWYLHSANLRDAHPYMICLLTSQELFADGGVLEIHHGQKVKYYKDIRAGKSDGAVVLAIEDQAGGLPALQLDADDAYPAGQPDPAADPPLPGRPAKRRRQAFIHKALCQPLVMDGFVITTPWLCRQWASLYVAHSDPTCTAQRVLEMWTAASAMLASIVDSVKGGGSGR